MPADQAPIDSNSHPNPEELLKMEDLVKLMKLDERTIKKIQLTKDFPKPIAFTKRSHRWIKTEVMEWLQAQRLRKNDPRTKA